jgi:glutamate synthase (NADPH/NADH) small chain
MDQMTAEGVRFLPNSHVGTSIPIAELRKQYHAIVIAIGAEAPRNLPVPGRELQGIHFAMDFLPQQNKRVAGDPGIVADPTRLKEPILATGKHVVIIGGGDTGADCLGTSHRQKARSIHQFEIMPRPPEERAPSTPWPLWPLKLRTESSHEEGGIRDWSISTTHFSGENGAVKKLHGIRVGPPPKFERLPGTEFTLDAELVLLAMGFTGPSRNGLLESLEKEGLQLDQRGNIATDENCMSSLKGVFAAGDARRGQSLVVWAIAEGRKAARSVDEWLMGESRLS